MTDPTASQGLTDAERALLAAYRRRHRTGDPAPARPSPSDPAQPDSSDSDETRLLEKWREWREHPLTRPPWFAALRQRVAEPDPPVPDTGLAGPGGYLPAAASRCAGMLLGAAAAEFAVLGRLGERTTSVLFALEGLLRAHTELRVHGAADPARSVLGGLQRWMHTRGVPWQDCCPDSEAPDGWLVQRGELHSTALDEPALLTALTRVAAGGKVSPHASGATAVPLGAVAALWSSADAFGTALDFAALSHGHPDGNRPAGVLGAAISLLLHGVALPEALRRAFSQWPQPLGAC